jgi:4-hydroxythreonine-4-phosphate dehydrogenase
MRSEPETRGSLPLAVSMGDPAGIGLEIALKAWLQRTSSAVPSFVLFADPATVVERARALGLAVPVTAVAAPTEASQAFRRALPVLPVPLAAPSRPGVPDPANGPSVIAAIEAATAAVVRGDAAALVTAPIAKHLLRRPDFAYPGHTELLGALAAQHFPGRSFRPVMMLAARELRVVPLTVHCPLAAVPAQITRRLVLETIGTVHEALTRDFRLAAPRIAVTGLNPHAGEQGDLGREEIEVIGPAIAEALAEGFAVTGPHPADTLFHQAARRTFDAAIAMYHDQALIPFKTVAFEDGVNVTLGLPFVRTSPDHGTAFDIAAAGRASPQSFLEALRLAVELAEARAFAGPA